jgi:hypothetical protein
VLRSSGETTLCVREDSAEVHELKNPSRIQKEQAQEDEFFQAQSVAARSAEVEELFGGVQSSQKLRRNNVFIRARELKVKEFAEEKEDKG